MLFENQSSCFATPWALCILETRPKCILTHWGRDKMESSWVRVVLSTSCIGYKLSWVRVVLGTSCLGYEMSWVRVVHYPVYIGYPSQMHLKLNYREISFAHNLLLNGFKSFSNFAQSTAVSLPWKPKISEKLKLMFWTNEISRDLNYIARPPNQPPVILSGTPELGWAPLTCICWQINSFLANIGHRNSIRILNQYPSWWNISIWA